MTEDKDAEIIQFHPEVNSSGMPPLDQMTQDELRSQLARAVEEHGILDERLTKAQQMSPLNKPADIPIDMSTDMVEIARFKKNKLLLKDRIQTIKAKLLPDIIA